MKKHWFHVLLLLIIATPIHAQLPSTPPPRGMMHPSVVSRHFALTIPLPLRTPLYPPLQSSMPLDVMLGYIYFDSLVRSVDLLHGQFDSAAAFATNSDTLRNGLKYLYKMSDWDPITLFEYKENAPIMSGVNSGPYKNCSPSAFIAKFLSLYERLVPDSGAILTYITKSDIIAHVTVQDTFNVVDYRGDTIVRVHCLIDDPIKGNNLLPCLTYNTRTHTGSGSTPSVQTAVGDCLDFAYSYSAESRIRENGIMTAHRFPHWITPGNDYIVFLDYQYVGSDSTGKWVTLMPILEPNNSTVLSMYPVSNGTVYDPSDDFHFGKNLSVAAFKAVLRSKIQTILSAQ